MAYILGVAVGTEFCGPETPAVRDPDFWAVTICKYITMCAQLCLCSTIFVLNNVLINLNEGTYMLTSTNKGKPVEADSQRLTEKGYFCIFMQYPVCHLVRMVSVLPLQNVFVIQDGQEVSAI